MPTLSLLVREKYFLLRPAENIQVRGGRALEIDRLVAIVRCDRGCDRRLKPSSAEAINAEDDAVEQEAVQQLGVREQ